MRTNKTVWVLSLLLDRLCQEDQEDDDHMDSLYELPFPTQSTQVTSHECKLTGWPWANKHQNKMPLK